MLSKHIALLYSHLWVGIFLSFSTSNSYAHSLKSFGSASCNVTQAEFLRKEKECMSMAFHLAFLIARSLWSPWMLPLKTNLRQEWKSGAVSVCNTFSSSISERKRVALSELLATEFMCSSFQEELSMTVAAEVEGLKGNCRTVWKGA